MQLTMFILYCGFIFSNYHYSGSTPKKKKKIGVAVSLAMRLPGQLCLNSGVLMLLISSIIRTVNVDSQKSVKYVNFIFAISNSINRKVV